MDSRPWASKGEELSVPVPESGVLWVDSDFSGRGTGCLRKWTPLCLDFRGDCRLLLAAIRDAVTVATRYILYNLTVELHSVCHHFNHIKFKFLHSNLLLPHPPSSYLPGIQPQSNSRGDTETAKGSPTWMALHWIAITPRNPNSSPQSVKPRVWDSRFSLLRTAY